MQGVDYAGRPPVAGSRVFSALGRTIVRHPWYPIIFWVLLLVIAVPAIVQVNSVTTNSATTLPDSAPSVIAQTKIERLFPSQANGSNTFVLLTGAGVGTAAGQPTVLAITNALATDRRLVDVTSVSSLYSAYQSYLAGEAQLALGFLGGALGASPSLPTAVNQSAALVWGPPALYVSDWVNLVQNGSVPPAQANWRAFDQAWGMLSVQPAPAQAVLAAFYNGTSSGAGFNQTSGACLSASPLVNVAACADASARAALPGAVAQLITGAKNQSLSLYTLQTLVIQNFTTELATHAATVGYLGRETGIAPSWLGLIWNEFPRGLGSSGAIATWTGTIANGSISLYPLPIPPSLTAAFATPAGTATLIVVGFSVSDSYTAPNGSTPVFDDLARINSIVPPVLKQVNPSAAFTFYQTGPSYLDQNENHLLSSNLQIILPLTVLVLIFITILYFRAPGAPLVTFSSIGIALALGLGAVFLIGKYVTHFDVTSLTLVDTFVLGVGTDYSVFLVARYREELVNGADPKQAVITTVTWAGESIATSGVTVIVSTVAMAFSGIALLSQWGIALSVSVLITLLLALTVTPALLTLLGPRLFWPYTRERFARQAARSRAAALQGRTYFARAGTLATGHPMAVLAVILLVSVPLIYVALNVPLSYDFYAQLPNSQPAAQGLQHLEQQFGPGYVFPTIILVTFERPVVVGNASDAGEFTDVAAIQSLMNHTSGVSTVDSPVGIGGAPASTWVNYSTLPPAQRITLRGVLPQYVGNDGRTVWFTVTPASDGLSNAAVSSLNVIEGRLGLFEQSHPEVRSIDYGGAASTVKDLGVQTAAATERMAIAATIGLFLVLFLVLGSIAIPPVALATIGLSISWAYAITYLLIGKIQGAPIFFFVPTILFVLILGLGMDYNVFILTRVREERVRDSTPLRPVVRAVTHTGGVITAAAVILASAFLVLGTSTFTLLEAIGLAVGLAVVLDAMVIRTYVVPAALALGKAGIWRGPKRLQRIVPASDSPDAGTPPGPR
ncbi:MAG: MMPL family transporter [Thermoplasmata archaeon]|nr:MMPL family transporter [Thermoplasmata archaeon]